jgi:hypothetical protein
MIAHLGATQTELGLRGSVGEIGVHHGRLFILLYLMCTGAERAFAVDVFADQERNVDGSGRGNEAIFTRNLERHAGTRDRLDLFPCDSNTLAPSEIEARTGRCRMISIDGGHTAATTENDLRLAEDLLMEGGIAVLDDYFNPLFPDVSTGAARYFSSAGRRLAPFLITPGKLFLCAGSPDAYLASVWRTFAWRRVKESAMFGSPVVVYGIDPPRLVDRLVLRVAAGPLRPYLRPAYRAVRRVIGL